MAKYGNGYTAAECIAAARKSRGFVVTIAKNLACSRVHVYRMQKKYPTFAQAIKDEREELKDLAEGKLLQRIQAGNMTAIIFYLKTQAQDRGYIERQQFELDPSDKFEKLLRELKNGPVAHPETKK